MNKLILSGIVSLAALTTGRSEGAAEPVSLHEQLSRATSLECRFTTVAAGGWDNGVPKSETVTKELKLTFTNINIDEATADANSQFGDFYVVVRFSTGYLHLMQMFSSGPLYTTTVLARETTPGRMMAIHTRHEYVPATVPGFESRPETWLGDCAVGN